jgi:hypothetical protein
MSPGVSPSAVHWARRIAQGVDPGVKLERSLGAGADGCVVTPSSLALARPEGKSAGRATSGPALVPGHGRGAALDIRFATAAAQAPGEKR